MTSSTHIIEDRLPVDPDDDSTDIRADIVFTYTRGCPWSWTDPGWPPEVEILDVLPLGCPPPIAPDDLKRLAQLWLNNGGYDSCCRLAEQKRGE